MAKNIKHFVVLKYRFEIFKIEGYINKMIDSDNIIHKVSEHGYVKIPNFLNKNEVQACIHMAKDKIKGSPLGSPDQYIAVTLKSLFIKLAKLDFKKFIQGISFLNIIRKRPELKKIINGVFKVENKLSFVDGYNLQVGKGIDWHADKLNDDYLYNNRLLIFIYLTNVTPEDGCMGYIRKSHKITYQIKKGIIEKKIDIKNNIETNIPLDGANFSLKFLKKIVTNEKNYKYLKDNLEDKQNLDNFINKIESIMSGESSKDSFDEMKPGDAIIFDQRGIHGGTKSNVNDRIIVRMAYNRINQN